jgi:hypothetical protein
MDTQPPIVETGIDFDTLKQRIHRENPGALMRSPSALRWGPACQNSTPNPCGLCYPMAPQLRAGITRRA